MNSVSFRGKVRESGTVHLVTVPAQYIKDGHLKPSVEYEFTAVEVSSDAE